ncbi:hypothetical protein D9756_001627 [Leucocoprinus leucothites]|uniref:Uncharacterized protein n=1 Tax=Leucocoprinus leucothites TaxID=201217 RepID=A0A8H5G4N9_9AGAR|nr:hypothetical protein D9756_001627 [Leucoagaricus leucothites]
MDPNYTGSRHSNYAQQTQHLSALPAQPKATTTESKREEERRSPSKLLASDIPDADLSVDFSSIMGEAEEAEKAQIEKRKSNLLKLNEENEELRQKLKAMNDRLEAAERKRAQLQGQDQKGGNS